MSICSKSDCLSQLSLHNELKESRISSWISSLPKWFIYEEGNGEGFRHPLSTQHLLRKQHNCSTYGQMWVIISFVYNTLSNWLAYRYPSSKPFVPHKQRHISSAKESQNHRQKQRLYQSRSGRDTRYVVYYLNDFPTPFAQRIKDRNFTLGDFKTEVFLRKGEYR